MARHGRANGKTHGTQTVPWLRASPLIERRYRTWPPEGGRYECFPRRAADLKSEVCATRCATCFRPRAENAAALKNTSAS